MHDGAGIESLHMICLAYVCDRFCVLCLCVRLCLLLFPRF